MHVEDLSIDKIAHSVKTPFYCYSSSAMKKNYNELTNSLSGLNTSIFYAIKANSNLAIIKLFSDLGAGADVVSEGEIRRALEVGIQMIKYLFRSWKNKERDSLRS